MNLRRMFAAVVVAAAVALVTAPAANAVNYPTPETEIACSPATIAAGGTATCVVSGGDPGDDVVCTASADLFTPTLDGVTTAVTKPAGANGTASFVVGTPNQSIGDISMNCTVAGDPVDNAVIQVAVLSGEGDDVLAFTGADNTELMVGSAVLLLAGAGAVALAGRRRAAQRV